MCKSASNLPSKSKPPQAHGLVVDVPNCSIDPVNFSMNSKNSTVPLTLLPLPKETSATKPVEFENHVDLSYNHNQEDKDENRGTYGKGQMSLDEDNRGLKGSVFSEGIMTPSDVINHDKRSPSFSNTCEKEASKGMKKKRSGIEKIMGELKKKSTRTNTKTCRKVKADVAILNKLLDTSKSINLREQNDGASKSVNRRKSAAPTLFEAEAVEEPKLKLLSTMVKDEKTATQGFSGTGFRNASKPSTDTTSCTSDGLHNFTQAYARKKQTEKIKRFMDKQKKKSERGTERKYAGFGEQILPIQKESNKKRKKIEYSDQDIAKKNPKVSKSELDLIEELLNIANSAVAESKSAEVVDDLVIPNNVTSAFAPVNNSTPELEEIQSNERTGAMVDDLTSLLEL